MANTPSTSMPCGVTISSSGIHIEVTGRMARVIAYLVAHQTALALDTSAAGKLLILWGEDWMRLRKEEDYPPVHEPIDRMLGRS